MNKKIIKKKIELRIKFFEDDIERQNNLKKDLNISLIQAIDVNISLTKLLINQLNWFKSLLSICLILLLFGCSASYETTDIHTTHYILTHGQWELKTDEYTEYFKFNPDYTYQIFIANEYRLFNNNYWNIIEDTLIIGTEVIVIDSLDYRNIYANGFKLSKL